MPSVGYATLQIIPSIRGISDDIRRQLVGPAGDAGGQAGQAAGSSLTDKLKVGAAAAGVAAGALVVKGLMDAVGQANITSTLQAQLGTSNKVAAQQGKLAGKLYSSGVTDSFQSAADSIKSVMQAGLAPPGATTKQLESLATKASDVANVFDQDLGGVTNAVSQMLRTGLAKNAGQAFDLITKGFQSGADKAGDLLDTINEYGVQFKKAGLDGAAAIGVLNQGLKAGARDGDLVADAIKEFSIRAVDGSKTTATGFKALGLNADDMAKKFGAGGKSASGALDATFDRLRAIKDPVKQSQAAVALFGTQAEDLGKALFAIDPSKAAKGLGQVGGAAEKVGKTIRSGPSHEIQVFTRTLQQGLVDFLGGKVLPTVSTLAHGFNTTLLPPIRTVGSVLAATLVPALTSLWTAGAAVVTWLRDMGTWLIPIGIAVAGFTAALLAQQIATAAVTAVFSIYRGAILAWTAVQRGATIAQAAFNAVMNANPVILVITAIVALGAALYIAYQRSETFRSIVQAAWAGIQSAALYAWNSVLKPAFAGLQTGLSAVGAAFSWLWNTVIKPVFSFIDTAARILLTVITIVVFGPIYLAVKALGAVFSWLWTNAISPVVGFIVAGLRLLWAGAQVIFGYFTAGLRTVGKWATWLWRTAISPVVGLIVGGFKLLWTGVKVVLGYFTGGLRALGASAGWLYRSAVKPAFDAIGAAASWLWTKGLKPALDSGKRGVALFGAAFGAAKDAIKIAWDKVKGIAKAPIAFVVNTVYSKGIVPVWNTVAKAFGAPTLDAMKFATGGVLPGYTPGRDVHLAALSGGEAVMRPEWTRAVGPGYVHTMNAAARSGGVGAIRRMVSGGMPAFADGGIFGWVKSAASRGVDLAKEGVDWLKDGVKASALAGLNSIVKPLIDKISGSASLYRDMITGVPKKMISTVLGFSGKADGKLDAAGIGGKGYKSALSFARGQAGKPYVWGGVGPNGYDCSGFMSALENIIRGLRPYARRWATGAFSGATAPAGWVRGARSPFQVGITNAGVGHTAGTLNGVHVESRGGDGVVVGSRARGANDSLFTDVYGLKGYANGGSPRPGEVAWVGENGPELIRFSGGEVVYSNAESMRVASGLGPLRGFAKGTSAASRKAAARVRTSARKDLPGDLTAFSKSLTGSASGISKAAKELVKDLKAAGIGGKSLAASVGKASAKLQLMAKQRDIIAGRIATAKAAAADQKKTAADYLGLSNLAEAPDIFSVVNGMKERQGTVADFQRTVAALSKKGLSKDLISQLVAMGPDSQLAGVLAGASPGQIKELNALSASGAKLSTSYGNTMADAMYDAGKMASKGFLTGLLADQKSIQSAMAKIGAGAIKAIRSKRGIDAHSPSRKGAQAGADLGAGLRIGLDATASTVAAAAARVADAAVPAVAPSASSAAGLGGRLTAGQPVTLVVQDGPTLRAYVAGVATQQVNAGMTQVRRTVKARSRR